MERNPARFATRRVTSPALILGALESATSHALNVPSRSVPRGALTDSAICHVLYPATGFLARSAAWSSATVVINVSHVDKWKIQEKMKR